MMLHLLSHWHHHIDIMCKFTWKHYTTLNFTQIIYVSRSIWSSIAVSAKLIVAKTATSGFYISETSLPAAQFHFSLSHHYLRILTIISTTVAHTVVFCSHQPQTTPIQYLFPLSCLAQVLFHHPSVQEYEYEVNKEEDQASFNPLSVWLFCCG